MLQKRIQPFYLSHVLGQTKDMYGSTTYLAFYWILVSLLFSYISLLLQIVAKLQNSETCHISVSQTSELLGKTASWVEAYDFAGLQHEHISGLE